MIFKYILKCHILPWWQSCTITPVFSVTWSFFGAQETFLIINVETGYDAEYFLSKLW